MPILMSYRRGSVLNRQKYELECGLQLFLKNPLPAPHISPAYNFISILYPPLNYMLYLRVTIPLAGLYY